MLRRGPLARRSGTAALALVALAFGCGERAPAEARSAVLLRAHAPGGEPISGARAWADGRAFGATGDDGALHAELRGREGAAVELTAACPPAYRTEPPSRRIVLRRLQAARVLELGLLCIPLETTAALIVIASGPRTNGLPVRVQGEVIGQTDAGGSAHLFVTAAADSAVRVQIDTSDRSGLRPRSPVHTLQLGAEPTILLVEQTFTPAPRPRAAPPRPTFTAPARPRRLD